MIFKDILINPIKDVIVRHISDKDKEITEVRSDIHLMMFTLRGMRYYDDILHMETEPDVENNIIYLKSNGNVLEEQKAVRDFWETLTYFGPYRWNMEYPEKKKEWHPMSLLHSSVFSFTAEVTKVILPDNADDDD